MTTASVLTHARFQPEPEVRFDRAVTDFLDRLELTGSGSAESRRAYASVLRAFARETDPAAPVSEVFTREAVNAFAAARSHLAPATANRNRSILRSFAAWCQRNDLLTVDPTDRIEHRRNPISDVRAIGYRKLERLLDDKRHHVRERALWSLLYSTAARAQEILSLDVTDLDTRQHRAVIRTKGGKLREIYWDTRTARLLPYVVEQRDEGPLFLTARRAGGRRTPAPDDVCPITGRARLSYRRAETLFVEASRLIDPEGWTLHQLRHSWTQHAADRGRTAHELQSKTGHAHLATLGRYLRPSAATAERVTREDDPGNRKRR